MKKINYLLLFSLLLLSAACFKVPKESGYMGDNIYLQGGDTLKIAIGNKVQSTGKAWLDGSTTPVKFEIVGMRDELFDEDYPDLYKKLFPSRVWNQPYDFLTDDTEEKILNKITDMELYPIMINEVNGQMLAMESTSEVGVQPGDIFNVDVRVTNSKGSKVLKDYVVIEFEAGAATRPFVIRDFTSGIGILVGSEYFYPYYNQINDTQSDFTTRRDHIYNNDGAEKFHVLRRLTDKEDPSQPETGIRLTIAFRDKDGKLFDPNRYASQGTLRSLLDYSVNHHVTDKGLVIEFPLVPWPVAEFDYSYMRGPYYTDVSNLDMTSIKADNLAGRISGPTNFEWPENDYADMSAWFVRVRSSLEFYVAGSYLMEITVPYSTAK